MLFSAFSFLPEHSINAYAKLDSRLYEIIENNETDRNELFSCVVWFDDINMEEPIFYALSEANITVAIPGEEGEAYIVYDENGKAASVDFNEKLDRERIQRYISSKREKVQALYREKNAKYNETYFAEKQVGYVSSFSPCIFAKLSKEEINELVKVDDVKYIGCFSNDLKPESNSFDSNDLVKLQENINLININAVKNNYSVDGTGVKIGIYELYCPNIATVIKNPDYCATGDHPTSVYTILHTIAPNADYYASGMYDNYGNLEYANNGEFAAQIEWLLQQNVNIINMSYGVGADHLYDNIEMWMDHIAFQHDVHIVVAAGNFGADGVSSPGMAYNVITVGNITSSYNYDLFSSSYNVSGASSQTMETFKPDIVAPGVLYNHAGTSYSAPMVAGTIALMCDYRSSMLTKQHTVKAILATGTTIRKQITTNSDFKKYGGGAINASSIFWIMDYWRYAGAGIVSASNPIATYNMQVLSTDVTMRVTLTYTNRIVLTGTGHPASGTPNETIGNLNLYIYAPNGQLVASCTTVAANVKTLEFSVATYGAGNYTIKVEQSISASNNRDTYFGLGWR